MVTLGLALSSEEHGPTQLVELAVAAEQAGFDFVSISDHYHPWLNDQGHSPFVWSVLGAIAARTTHLGVGTGVTCPTVRGPRQEEFLDVWKSELRDRITAASA